MAELLQVTVSAGPYASVRAAEKAQRLFGVEAVVHGIVGSTTGSTYTFNVSIGETDYAFEFWQALGIQQEWMNKPEIMYDQGELIWKMTAKEGFLFDDSFWGVFAKFPFRICHVSYSGAPWSHEGGSPEMVLRFALEPWVTPPGSTGTPT